MTVRVYANEDEKQRMMEAHPFLIEQMRGFVEGELEAFLPENMVSYATGPPPGVDAPGTGPGMYYALWVAEGLRSRGCSCFSGLCVGGGANWKIYLIS